MDDGHPDVDLVELLDVLDDDERPSNLTVQQIRCSKRLGLNPTRTSVERGHLGTPMTAQLEEPVDRRFYAS